MTMSGAKRQTLPATLNFEDTEIGIIDLDGRPWVTAADLARALGYASEDAVSRIYRRNTDEFSEAMSGTVNLTVPSNPMPIPVRIFSPRGAHLIAMLARTKRAKAFRRWVLDVLDALADDTRTAAARYRRLLEAAPPLPDRVAIVQFDGNLYVIDFNDPSSPSQASFVARPEVNSRTPTLTIAPVEAPKDGTPFGDRTAMWIDPRRHPEGWNYRRYVTVLGRVLAEQAV